MLLLAVVVPYILSKTSDFFPEFATRRFIILFWFELGNAAASDSGCFLVQIIDAILAEFVPRPAFFII